MTDHSIASARSAPDRGTTLHVGRYALHRQIARGGMATIHVARLVGDEGFSRIVAAKRLLPELAEDPEFVAMFLDEARIASRVHHRNVVPVLDVVNTGDEVVLVQEYVHGVPLHWLLSRARQTEAMIPIEISVGIACQVLAGLHAAHETTDEMGTPLQVIHRDVSPQNVMIATDGTARLLDFGVAKSLMAAHVTREGTYKGKLAYSAPEQLLGAAVRQSDVYSLTVLLWELLVGHRLHRTAQAEAELVATIMNGKLPSIIEALMAEREWDAFGAAQREQLQALEPIIKRGLAVEAADRFPTAAEMEEALARVVQPATCAAIGQWLRDLGREYLERNDKILAAHEASWRRAAAAAPPVRESALSIREPAPPVREPAPAIRDSAPAIRDSAPAIRDSAPAIREPALPGDPPGPEREPARGVRPPPLPAGVPAVTGREPTLPIDEPVLLDKPRPLSVTVPMRPTGGRPGDGASPAAPAPSAMAPAPLGPSPSRHVPEPSSRRPPYLLVALLSVLTGIVLGVVVVVIDKAGPAPAAPAAPAGSAELPAAAKPAAPPAAAPPAAAPAAPPAPPAAPATPATTTGQRARPPDERRPARPSSAEPAPPAPAVRSPERSAGRPGSSARPARPAKAVAPEPPARPRSESPPAEARPPAKDPCDPPYYFEGTKKIFKPACL
jgi:eukaryotic-like serine/threonine-protein kinase